MEFILAPSGPPPGSYDAEFLGAEPYTDNADKYGNGVALRWKIIGGDQDGAIGSRICSEKFSPKSNLAKFAAAVKGAPIAVGESFNFADHVAATGMLIVEETDSGSTRVATFIRKG